MESDGNISIDKRGEFVWIRLPASITVDNYRLIENRISAALTKKGDRVVLDCAQTENMYSSGIGLIVRLKKTVSETAGTLALVNVSQRIRNLMEDMHLEKMVPIYATDVEFEISHDDAWREALSAERIGFVFTALEEGGVHRLSLSGYMDALHDLSAVSEYKPKRQPARYVIGLENLDMMDTYGAQLFLELVQRIGAAGGTCAAYGASEMIRELLHLLSIERFVRHYDSEKQALEAVAG